jgi:cystathionine beta-lyase/cystathionine gamma-synthase
MIVFESMNKYYQFGMDRTTGGVIYTWGKDTEKLFYTRQHSGTIMSDISSYLLPLPDRKLLEQRLNRHERNTKIFIEKLFTNYMESHPHNPLRTIVYPTLPNHPAYAWAKDLSFHGSFFTFSWKKKYDTIKMYKKFLSLVMSEAKRSHVQLVNGTSFGMNTSRIYLTAPNTKFGQPFVRFSVGTETILEIEKLKQVLILSLEKL